MKTMDELTDDEVQQLSTRVMDAVAGLLPEDTIFVLVMGGHRNHRATLANVPPEILPEVFRKAAQVARRNFIENN